MKKNYWFAVLAGALLLPATAWAESLSGTVTDIDGPGGTVTLLRTGTNESVRVSVRDQVMLANLRTGSSVSLDAADRGAGNWEARSLTPAGTGLGANSTIGANTTGAGVNSSLGTNTTGAGVNSTIGANTSGMGISSPSGSLSSGVSASGGSASGSVSAPSSSSNATL